MVSGVGRFDLILNQSQSISSSEGIVLNRVTDNPSAVVDGDSEYWSGG